MATVARQYERRDGISLARLHLDPENPRHDPIEDEDKIIGHLCRRQLPPWVKSASLSAMETAVQGAGERHAVQVV